MGGVLAAAALLAGCGALRFAYNQAPELVYWRLDGYVDFDDAQSAYARRAIADWFHWNRSTQLKDYAAMLAKMRQQVREPTSAPAVCHWVDEVTARMHSAYERATPAMAEVGRTMTLAQVRHLERKYAKSNEEWADHRLQPSPKERLKEAVKRAVKRADMLYGSVEPAQREIIERGVAASPEEPEAALAERKARQQESVAMLQRWIADKAPVAKIHADLRLLGEHAMHSPREPYRAYRQRVYQHNCALAAQVHEAASPALRQRAAERLQRWEDDLHALAAHAAP